MLQSVKQHRAFGKAFFTFRPARCYGTRAHVVYCSTCGILQYMWCIADTHKSVTLTMPTVQRLTQLCGGIRCTELYYTILYYIILYYYTVVYAVRRWPKVIMRRITVFPSNCPSVGSHLYYLLPWRVSASNNNHSLDSVDTEQHSMLQHIIVSDAWLVVHTCAWHEQNPTTSSVFT